MFQIYRFLYISKKTHSKHEIFARDVSLADSLAQRITNLGIFNLRRAKIGFCKKVYSKIPPYELEQEQISLIESWEEKRIHYIPLS